MIFVGSALPALLWGVALGNMIRGVPINADMIYTGNLLTLLNPYALLCGVASLFGFTLHGALFLSLRSSDEIADRANKAVRRLWAPTVAFTGLAVGVGYFVTDVFSRLGANPGVVPLTAGVALLAAGWFIRERREGWAFIMVALSVVFTTITFFVGLYPRVLVSSLNEDWSLTIRNAASSEYTLKVMTIVALLFVPVVLFYQGWSYWIFRKRIRSDSKLEY
jgi:cytochrome d ubiquinol oxidase subunit II